MITIDKNKKLKNFIKRIAENDGYALKEFYDYYFDMIFLTAKSVCRTKEKADDVVNRVLVKIWHKAAELLNRDINESWLYVVTVNCAKDLLKEKTLPSINYDYAVIATDKIQEFIDEDAFISLLCTLDEEEKEIIIYRFTLDFTFKKIADIMGKPSSTVSSMFYRALDKIEEYIGKTDTEQESISRNCGGGNDSVINYF